MISMFLFSFILNALFLYILLYLIYYRKYKDIQSTNVYMLFGIFIFVIIYFLTLNEISFGVGFAIFGLVSLVRLRSDVFTRVDIVYFVAVMTISIIIWLPNNNIWRPLDTNFLISIFASMLILVSTYFIENMVRIRAWYNRFVYTLDEIPSSILSDKKQTIEILQKKLNTKIYDYEIIQLDQTKDSVVMNVIHKNR